MPEKAMQLFSKISNPNHVIFSFLFTSCSQTGTKQALDLGRKVWFEMPSAHRQNKYVLTSALNMFITCGDLSNAENLFTIMKPEVIEYGQMLKCYNNHKMPMKTINLYEKMKNEGIQGNPVIFILLVDACAQIGIKSLCQSIVSQTPLAFLTNFKLQNALIHMWVSAVSLSLVSF
jgi:pentatricopeptide repeat protein